MEFKDFEPMDYDVDENGCSSVIPIPRAVSYEHRFLNEDGFVEWVIKDHYGNPVVCYFNGYYEIHVKQPWCYTCDTMMVPIGSFDQRDTFKWKCPHCGRTCTRDDVEHADAHLSHTYKINYRNDYGAFASRGTQYIAGSMELYASLCNKNYMWPDNTEKGYLIEPPFDFILKP